LDRAQQRVDEQQFRMANAWQGLLHAKAAHLQRLHGHLLQQSRFQALHSRSERCTTAAQRLHRAMQRRLFTGDRAREVISNRLLLQSPTHRCHRLRQTIDYLESRSRIAIATGIERASAARKELDGRLAALSPLSVLERGYSLTFTSAGQLVHEASTIATGAVLKTRLARGTVTSTVVHTEDKI
jgi:exodeoxyribonuclease VII large subunit